MVLFWGGIKTMDPLDFLDLDFNYFLVYFHKNVLSNPLTTSHIFSFLLSRVGKRLWRNRCFEYLFSSKTTEYYFELFSLVCSENSLELYYITFFYLFRPTVDNLFLARAINKKKKIMAGLELRIVSLR